MFHSTISSLTPSIFFWHVSSLLFPFMKWFYIVQLSNLIHDFLLQFIFFSHRDILIKWWQILLEIYDFNICLYLYIYGNFSLDFFKNALPPDPGSSICHSQAPTPFLYLIVTNINLCNLMSFLECQTAQMPRRCWILSNLHMKEPLM